MGLACQLGAPFSSRAEAERIVRSELNALWRTARRGRTWFVCHPQPNAMLRGVYYDDGSDIVALDRIRARIDTCMRNLYCCTLWGELARCEPGEIRVVDELTHFDLHGTRVYVAPDLVYRGGDGHWTVVDWKTGSARGTSEQLAVYALYARDVLRVPLAAGRVRYRTIHLATGADAVEWIDAEAIAAAERRISDDTARMHARLVDDHTNIPHALERFALAANRRACARCNFRELCHAELNARDAVSGAV